MATSFLVSAVFTRCDLLLEDSSKARWPDLTARILWLNDGIRLLRGKRPDARYNGDNGNKNAFTDLTATTDTIYLDDYWMPALVDYTCGRCFQQDAEDENDLRRAKQHIDMFWAALKE